MLDEEMDDIIREAASKHHPAYNDTAWEKMQQKLDIHLPQKDDRRKYIYWLLLFLLLSGSTFTGLLFYYNNKEKKEKETIAQRSGQPASQPDQSGTGQPGKNNRAGDGTNSNNTNGSSSLSVNTTPGNNNTNAGDGVNGTANSRTPQTGNVQPGSSNTVTGKNPDGSLSTTPVKDRRLTTGGTRNNKTGNNKDKTDKDHTLAFTRKKNGRFNTSIIAPGQTTNNDQVTGDEKLFDPSGKRKISTRSRTRMQVNAPQAIADQNSNKPGKKKKQDKPVADEVETNEDPATVVLNPVPAETYQQRADKENATKTSDPEQKIAQPEEKKKDEPQIVKKEEKKTDSAEKKITVASKKPEEKKKKGFGNNFGITVSAGTDLSFIKTNELGKATFIYGAGLSYDFAKRFTVQAGFLASKKIYRATPEQYYLPTPHPYLENIDAVCKVYEIPVSVSYRFAQKRNHNWFGGVGLSSFLMKKEDYDYNYKYPGGPSYQYRYSYANENKHYFSVLSLFAGYQYNLGDRVSLMAGPYYKMPLGGVGAGKIKLNSGGLLLTATVRPFAKKK